MHSATTHQRELEQLGRDIVTGSMATAEQSLRQIMQGYKELHGRSITEEELCEIAGDPPLSPSTRWGIGPSGAHTVESYLAREDTPISLSDFVGGIAVACDIHPEQRDIDTTIYFIGKYMGELGLDH